MSQVVKEDIDDRRRVERQDLAYEQAPNHRDAKGPAQFRADAASKREWDSAKQSRHGRHHDGTKAEQACLIDGVRGVQPPMALCVQRKVDHHNAILLHDADQQNKADDRDHAQVLMKEEQRKEGSYTRRGQRGENGDGVNEALVKYAEDNVDRNQRGKDQQRHIRERVAKGCRRSLKISLEARRHMHIFLHFCDGRDSAAQRGVGREIERYSDGRELTLVRNGKRLGRVLEV